MLWSCCNEYAQEVDKKRASEDVNAAISVDIGRTSEYADASALATGEKPQPLAGELVETASVLTPEPVAEHPVVPTQADEASPLVTLIEEGGESDITLQAMSGVSLGCELDITDDEFCMVSEVAVKGLVERWNSVHLPREQQLKVFDRIVQVACQPGPSGQLKVLLESETKIKYQTKVRYQRPRVQELHIQSTDGVLGLEFDELFKGNGLPIVKVLESNVHEAVSEAGLTAAQRSRIVAVNGEVQLAPSKIMEMMQAEEFKITVCSWN